MAETQTSRRCLFCGSPITKNNASREDTVPKWLLAELGISNEIVEPTLTPPLGKQLKQRIHPVDQLRTVGVCRVCNNGWMSVLESNVQPILRDLIWSRQSIGSLVRRDRQLLARWVVKTAFMLDAGGLEPRVSLAQISTLFTNASYVPPNLYVFSRQQPRTRSWYYIVHAWWRHAALTPVAQQLVEECSYKIGIQFGDVMFFVVYWPLERWGICIESNELGKLWPPNAIVKQFDHSEPQDVSTSEAALPRYNATISVVPHRGAEGFVPAGT